MTKKILHIIDSLDVGGAEVLLVGIINGLKDYEQHLVILNGPELLKEQMHAPMHFTNLKCGSFSQLFTKVGWLRKYIRENNIELVHSHLYASNLLARLATPRSVQLVNSIHAISSMASYQVNRMSLYLEKLSYKRRHLLVAVSKAVLDDFDKWVGLKGDHVVLYNFIDEKFFNTRPLQPREGQQLKLVSVGNLRWQKNYAYLVEAFKQLPAHVSLDIYGDGDLREGLQKEIDAHQLNIRFCGVRHDIQNVLPMYDAFVMSSFYEGQPVSLLEAMACGLPALLADIPVLREVTGDEAVYFDISDTKHFAVAIADVLQGKYDLAAFGRSGQKKVAAFAHRHQYLQRLEDIYKKALEQQLTVSS